MTEIIFGELFKNECSKFNVLEKEVIETIKGPDEIKRINLDSNHQLLFYLKKLSVGYYLLVDCQLRENQNVVQYAYKIYPDFMEQINSNDPMIVLEQFANKFGLEIQIGGFVEKFIAGDSFPVGIGQQPQNIVNISNPQNHSFLQSMMMRVRNEGQFQILDVSLAYCIDTTEYQKYLSENSS